jgi:dihydropteroate synthase
MSQLMGIINITPDSYVAHSRCSCIDEAVQRAEQLVQQGADIIDVGGESTRPGSLPVDEEEECKRILPVIDALSQTVNVPISVDTNKASVARKAIESGATIINDISGFKDERMIDVACSAPNAKLIVMHMQGIPKTMQQAPFYPSGVVPEVEAWLAAQAAYLEQRGIVKQRIILDPGIGFGKTMEQNFELILAIRRFQQLGYPLLYGVSRKSFLGALTSKDVSNRLAATLGVASFLMINGASILRIHDVAEHDDVRRVLTKILPDSFLT